MSRLAAFLRGINLGKRRVKMAELRGHFERMGLESVDSYIASGNVVFDDPGGDRAELEAEIEGHLEGALGFFTDTFVRTFERLGTIAGHEVVASAADDGLTPYVIFLKERADADISDALRSLEGPDDRFHVLGREVVWLRRGGISDAPLSTRDFEKAFGGTGSTRRKLSTLRKMLAKFGGS